MIARRRRSRGLGGDLTAWVGGLAAVAVALTAAPAWAQKVSPDACIKANEAAGPLRKAGKLREARASLRLCASDSCPGVVRKDCLAGAVQTDADVPTVAFSVQDAAGNDLADVKVSLDGQPLVEKLDGKAIDVDPGEHTFRFEAVGQPVVEKRLVIVEGEKNRRERVQVGEPKPAPVVSTPAAAPPPPPANTRKTVGYTVGAIGLAGLAGGGVAALVATLEWSAAKNQCGSAFPVACVNPGAANTDASATLRAGAVADILLIAGGLGFAVGTVLVLTAPSDAQGSRTTGVVLAPGVGPGAGGLTLSGSF